MKPLDPTGKSVIVLLRMPPGLVRVLDSRVRSEGVTRSEFIRRALVAALAPNGPKPRKRRKGGSDA